MHMLQLLFSIISVYFVFPLFFGYGNVCSHYSLDANGKTKITEIIKNYLQHIFHIQLAKSNHDLSEQFLY